MTLARQLILIFSTAFFIVFVGNFWNSLSHTRGFLHEQMVTNSQDLATSLGLLLRPYLVQNDEAGMQLLIDIYNDSGYYEEILLSDMDDNPIILRKQDVAVVDVPQWFVNMFPLEIKPAVSLITAGWYQAGKISVKRHPGFAYHILWNHAKGSLIRTFVAYTSVIAIFIFLINLLLRPLRAMEEQARAIGEPHFEIQEHIPSTRELAQVVYAMNQMSWKLKSALEELTEYADSMRLEAFSDHLTGLNNLRRFEASLEKLLRSEETGLQGAVAKIQIERFGEYCESNGYEQGERLLKDVSAMIELSCEGFAGAMPARVGSTEFGVLLPNSSRTEAASFGSRLVEAAKSLGPNVSVVAGIVCYAGGVRIGDLLVSVDKAVEQAAESTDHWHLLAREDEVVDTKEPNEWKALLLSALEQEKVHVVLQPIRSCGDRSVFYHEVLARLEGPDGELISAGAVVPLAKRLGRIQDFERSVVSKAIDLLRNTPSEVKVGLNLSFQSIHEPHFLDWVFSQIESVPGIAKRVILEISEHEVELDMATSKRIVERARQQGIQVAVEHFGVTFAGLSYLRELKPNIVKVDGSYVRDISKDVDSRSFVHTLVRFAHGLDIKVIGECTENSSDWNALAKLSVDGAQGYHVGQPRSIDAFVDGQRKGEYDKVTPKKEPIAEAQQESADESKES